MGRETGVQLQAREVIIPFITEPKPGLGPKQSSIQSGVKNSSAQIQWLDSKDDKSAQFRNTDALLPLPIYLHFIILKFLKKRKKYKC
jgi:hypothetical protein